MRGEDCALLWARAQRLCVLYFKEWGEVGVTWSTSQWFSVVFPLLQVMSTWEHKRWHLSSAHVSFNSSNGSSSLFLSHIQAVILAFQAQGPEMAFPGFWQIWMPSIMASIAPTSHTEGVLVGITLEPASHGDHSETPFWHPGLGPTESSLCAWCL